MKNLLKAAVLSIALLPFAAFAQEAKTCKTTGKVVNENENAPVEWVVSAEEAGEGLFAITFEATIAKGYHGYSMQDIYSAPTIEFEKNAEVVGEVVEPLTAKEHPDGFGGSSFIYYNNATYVYTVKANPGSNVQGFIQAIICTNETYQCMANYAAFEIVMPWEPVAETAKNESGEASGNIPPTTSQDYQINGRVENVNADRKYADFLHLPHQLEGHFDFEEAVAEATKLNKPIFVDVTGHACNNCREMETMVWSHSSVLPMLKNDLVICALYVDDNTKIEDGKRLGFINYKFAQERWGVNAQPGYILLSPDGETVLAGPRGYDTDIDGFVSFLKSAL